MVVANGSFCFLFFGPEGEPNPGPWILGPTEIACATNWAISAFPITVGDVLLVEEMLDVDVLGAGCHLCRGGERFSGGVVDDDGSGERDVEPEELQGSAQP